MIYMIYFYALCDYMGFFLVKWFSRSSGENADIGSIQL